MSGRILLGSLVVLAVLPCGSVGAQAPADGWRATWGAGMHGPDEQQDGLQEQGLGLYVAATLPDLRAHDQSLRQVVRTSIGGTAVRVRISNAFGRSPLRIGAVTVGVRGAGAAIAGTGLRAAHFEGRAGVDVPPGGQALSDPVALAVQPEQELAISMHVRGDSPRPTMHLLSLTSSFLSPAGSGNQTGDTAGATFTGNYRHWFWLSGVDVRAPEEAGTVVALGDSITDGAYVANALVESKDTSWPSRLAARLRPLAPADYARAVVNAGISGNMVTQDNVNAWFGTASTERFGRDVLDVSGVTHLILFQGTNDLGVGVSADTLIAGLRDLALRARARGLRVIGATLAPRSDGNPVTGGWTGVQEARRRLVNGWIRSFEGFDGVVDADRALADPADPTRLRRQYDADDGLHPNAAGRQAIADAVDLELLRCSAGRPETTLLRSGIDYRRGRLRVRGSSALPRCDDKPISEVRISVARLGPRGTCRYLGRRTRLLPARPCERMVEVRVRGGPTWRLGRDVALPDGRYRVTARARASQLEAVRSRSSVMLRVRRGAAVAG